VCVYDITICRSNINNSLKMQNVSIYRSLLFNISCLKIKVTKTNKELPLIAKVNIYNGYEKCVSGVNINKVCRTRAD